MADEQHDAGSGLPDPPAASRDDSSDDDRGMGDLAAEALRAAQEAIRSLSGKPTAPASARPTPAPTSMPGAMNRTGATSVPGPAPSPFVAPGLTRPEDEPLPRGLDLLADVNVNVTIELGRTRMLVEDVLRLSEGAVVELDKLAGDPVDVFVNERLVARGEILVLNDNFCVRVNEILDADQVDQT
jgi:flagellar motor switch protein FliN/FliY